RGVPNAEGVKSLVVHGPPTGGRVAAVERQVTAQPRVASAHSRRRWSPYRVRPAHAHARAGAAATVLPGDRAPGWSASGGSNWGGDRVGLSTRPSAAADCRRRGIVGNSRGENP